MTGMYFEPDSLKKLSNDDLMKKQKELESKLSKIKNMPSQYISDLQFLYECYSNEIDRRIESEEIDMDEIEDNEIEKMMRNLNEI